MTTAQSVERARIVGTSTGGAETVRGALAFAFLERARELGVSSRPEWPMVEYFSDPVAFTRLVLGVELMAEQVEILLAIRDSADVAIAGGRKVGKDFVVACAALWFFCSAPRARVQFTAVTEEQVQRVFWRQVCELLLGSGRCLACKRDDPAGPRPCAHSRLIIEERPPTLARTGLKDMVSGRELVGYTVGEASAIRGISGQSLFDIIDEASDVDDEIVAVLQGNKTGSAYGRTVMLSNPSSEEGAFYRAFHEQLHLWRTFTRSSVDIAEKYGGKIPGIARKDEVAKFIELHGGVEADYVKVHIFGVFVDRKSGRIFTIPALKAAIARWASTVPEGPLAIGVDVAGESGTGDESAFAARRGLRILSLHARRGLTPDAHLAEVLALLRANPSADPLERPTVVIDRGGEAGARVWGVFIAYRQTLWADPPFRLVGVDSSRKAQRDPKAYDRVRDELVASLADWMRAGGAIPDDPMLAAELNTFRWVEQRVANANRLVDKRTMRETLNRSPDRADAVALSCWELKRWAPATALAPAAAAVDVQQANEIWYEPPQQAEREGDSPWWPTT